MGNLRHKRYGFVGMKSLLIHTWYIIRWSLVAILITLAPIRPALTTVVLLPVVDLVLALLVAYRNKQPITSAGLKRTVAKILMYEVAVIAAFLTETYLTGDLVSCCKYVTALIGITELKSLLEHLDELFGGSFFKVLINKLAPPNRSPEE